VRALAWLRSHDRGYAALRRAGRTAIVMPALLALGTKVIEQPVVATFAAFGSFAMLLLVDFGGRLYDRVRNQAALAVACAVLIAVATLCSRTMWLAAVAMAVVGFGVLFAGVASSVLAGATQTLLLSFILPISLPGPASSIPDRLAGWGMASAASLVAIAVLWPAPASDPVRTDAIAACRALARRLRMEPGAEADSDAALARLHATFFATPFRPTGLSTAARAVVRLVDELRLLNAIVARAMPAPERVSAHVRAAWAAAATVLDGAADAVERPSDASEALPAAVERLHAALADLERAASTGLPRASGDVVSALDPSFRAQELSYLVAQVAANAGVAAAAERRSWLDRLLGRPPAGFPSVRVAARERTGAHLEHGSLWLQNSLRGAIGLGIAVFVADATSVQHSFWVVLGALSVLRSNALTTGQSVARAIAGTIAGFVVGGLLVALIGTSQSLLWALLPVVILFAGLAPAAVGFATGQAAFTLTVLIVFNILQPAGWELGLVRIEDVALGCAVSLVVGLLLWPRGAGAALARALSQAYRDSADYLANAVAFGLGCCDDGTPERSAPRSEAMRAAASSRRLDDAFRSYLAERGAKPVPLAEVTSLVTGVAGLRLAADAVLDLWRDGDDHDGDRAAARRELEEGSARMAGWYAAFASSLVHHGSVPEPLSGDAGADGRLVEAVVRDLRGPSGNATATAVKVIWTGDHLDAARRMQAMLVEPARAAVAARAIG
jgi:uncharacterized membrane protein YccC